MENQGENHLMASLLDFEFLCSEGTHMILKGSEQDGLMCPIEASP